jgi:hypothetical protein
MSLGIRHANVTFIVQVKGVVAVCCHEGSQQESDGWLEHSVVSPG